MHREVGGKPGNCVQKTEEESILEAGSDFKCG